jgi:hypothetical protein
MAGMVGLQETGNGDKLELNAETLLTGRGYDNPPPGSANQHLNANGEERCRRGRMGPGEGKDWLTYPPVDPR